MVTRLAAEAGGGIGPELIAAYAAVVAAVLTPLFTAIASSRKQAAETAVKEEIPRLRKQVAELSEGREADRRQHERERAEDRRRYMGRIDELEDEVTELRRYVYDLRQDIADTGHEPRPIPARLRLAEQRRDGTTS